MQKIKIIISRRVGENIKWIDRYEKYYKCGRQYCPMVLFKHKTTLQNTSKATVGERAIKAISLITLIIIGVILYYGLIHEDYLIIVTTTLIFILSLLEIFVIMWIIHARQN